MSYQQRSRFRTTLDFDREYLWNGSSNRQAENGVINYYFFHVRRKQFGELWCTYEKNNLKLWRITLKLNRVRAVRGKCHEAKCSNWQNPTVAWFVNNGWAFHAMNTIIASIGYVFLSLLLTYYISHAKHSLTSYAFQIADIHWA